MIYASGAMAGVSFLLFTFHLYRIVRRVVYPSHLKWHTTRLLAMILPPYITYVIIFAIEMGYGLKNKEVVHRSSFYCTIGANIAHLGPGIAVATICVAIILEGLIIFTLYRYWRSFKTLHRSYGEGLDFSLVIRQLIFTVLGICGVITSVAFAKHLTGQVPNLVLAFLPVLIFILFGTRRSLLRVWFFWKKDMEYEADFV